ncbi:MAG: nucleoside kinase [Solirubrobacterales bacterium]
MGKLNILIDGTQIAVEKGKNIHDFIIENNINKNQGILLVKINKKYYELTSSIEESGTMEIVGLSDGAGLRTYVRTLQFILIKAVYDLFPSAKVTIEHSLSKAVFGEIYKDTPLNQEDIQSIKKRMKVIIESDIKINKATMKKDDALKIFEDYGMQDKIDVLNSLEANQVHLYEMEGRFDYFYGYLAYSTGIVHLFDIMLHDSGFVLRYPVEPGFNKFPDFIENNKLNKIFRETEQWAKILDVGHVGSLNNKVQQGGIGDIVKISEALHEKKIANIADMISDREKVKLVLIAGPSSSGKTTFCKRLGIQLRVNGLMPVPISLDDYFVNRDDTPKDEYGNFDFEALEAVDLKLFNENLDALLNGEAVMVPDFDFREGKRHWKGKTMKLPENGVILVEGIHGLNDRLTSKVKAENKFKIYISALTHLNIDDHNRIATTDVRIMRRIVRDNLFRGCEGERTLEMWPSIRRGEERNIFVYQENADVMFNSTLVYELCVLKRHVLNLLSKIAPESDVYSEAYRLKSYLNFVREVPEMLVPDNSILREFIGGSSFYK